jgi:hypothetical protein
MIIVFITSVHNKMLHIITLGSNEDEMKYLKESAKRNGVTIQFILCEKWNGYIDKITTMKQVIEDIQDDDIVCFIDSYDVLLFTNVDEILSKFHSYDCDLLLSSELNCYPGENMSRYNEVYNTLGLEKMTNFKYVNSGGYIGYKRALQELFNWKPVEEIIDIIQLGGDQNYFTEYYLEFACVPKKNIKIDMFQCIFQSVYKLYFEDIEFKNGRVVNTVLCETPCFVHFNGYGGYYYQIYDVYNYGRDIRTFYLEHAELSKNGMTYNLDGYRPPYSNHFANIMQLP